MQEQKRMRRHQAIYDKVRSIPCICHLKPKDDSTQCETCRKVVILLQRFLDNQCELPLNYDRKGVYSNE